MMHNDTRTTPKSSGVENFEAKINFLFTEWCLVANLTKDPVKREEFAVYKVWLLCFIKPISFSPKVDVKEF